MQTQNRMDKANKLAAQGATMDQIYDAYPVQVIVDAELTKGVLKGSQIVKKVPFCDEADAQAWLAGIQRNAKLGLIDYRVISHRMEVQG